MGSNIGGGGEWGNGDDGAGLVERLVGEFLDAILPTGLDDAADDAITDGFASKASREVDSLFSNASLNEGQQVVADEVVAAIQDAIDSDFPEADVQSAAEDVLPDDFEALSDLIEEAAAIVDSYQEEALALSGESEE